jgi:hypothetical protein
MVDILQSVVDSDAANRLAGNYTVGGLHVVDVEHCEPPYSVITVETYGWGNTSGPLVAVRHVSSSGLPEKIIRPVDSAVALFWRFVIEKFSTRRIQIRAPAVPRREVRPPTARPPTAPAAPRPQAPSWSPPQATPDNVAA